MLTIMVIGLTNRLKGLVEYFPGCTGKNNMSYGEVLFLEIAMTLKKEGWMVRHRISHKNGASVQKIY